MAETDVIRFILQAVKFVRVESCPAQSVLPLVGRAADKVTRDGYIIEEQINVA
ncbi:MAG: hypothetical protein ACODAD_07105 [Planctomycetota bacterium]